jgi:hypothetical protein
MSDDRPIETADVDREDVSFPERWGPPAGEPGTPERRAWLIARIREDDPDEARSSAGALRQAEALREMQP